MIYRDFLTTKVRDEEKLQWFCGCPFEGSPAYPWEECGGDEHEIIFDPVKLERRYICHLSLVVRTFEYKKDNFVN